MSESITIPHSSLLETLQTVSALNLILGRDCYFDAQSYDLSVPLSVIDGIIEQWKKDAATPTPPTPNATTEPERIDRIVPMNEVQRLEALQLEAAFQQQWNAAHQDPLQEKNAYQDYTHARKELRASIILPQAVIDIDRITLVYGGNLPTCINLEFPNGITYEVEVLIHFSHPATPEERWLREKLCNARRIYRYRVPGLDDALWLRQEEPFSKLDAVAWRNMVLARL